MSSDLQFFLLGLPLIGFGAYLDLLLLRRHKVRLYDRLYHDWLLIEQTTVPDLARSAAQAMKGALAVPPARKARWGLAAKWTGLGWLVISFAGAIGGFMDGARDLNPYHWLPIFTVYFAVAAVGLMTLRLTFRMLGVIARASPLVILGLILANVGGSLVTAVLALPFVAASANHAYVNNWPGSGRGIYTMVDNLVLVDWHVGLFFVDQAADHFRKQPGQPFVFEQDDWTGFDPKLGIRHKAVKLSITMGPPTVPVDEWVRRMKAPPDLDLLVGEPPLEFIPSYGPFEAYVKDLGALLRNPLDWEPGIYGQLRSLDGSVKFSVRTLHLKFVPRWHLILSTAVVALPSVLVGFVLGSLVMSQLARKMVAAIAGVAIERVAESDPRVDAARFLPFTVTFVALALCFALVRVAANLLVRIVP